MTHRNYLELAIEAALAAGKKTLSFYYKDLEVVVKDDNSPLTQADLESNQTILSLLESSNLPVLSEETRVEKYKERARWKKFWLIDPLDGTKEFINKRSEYTINIALVQQGKPLMGVVYAPVLNTLYFGSSEEGSYKIELREEMDAKTILAKAEKISVSPLPSGLRVVASRSHLSDETKKFIANLEKYYSIEDSKSYGSSLKLCMVAESKADIYPRLGPTMEWDTAASHAVAIYAGSIVIELESGKSLQYNKENLLNPYFVVCHPQLEETVRKIISAG